MSKWQSISEIVADVLSGKTTATELVEKSLAAIDGSKAFDAIISVPKERALQRAAEIDKNPKGPLAGVPFVAKDNFLTFGGKTTAGTKYLKNFEAPYQATAINKLEAAGAICVAKANLDAWAHGSSTENSDFFVTKNPFDKTRVAGGSSGGSAVSVALDIAPFALGTDTGGSVRLPASFCGVIGLKPTYGAISRSGIVAMASSTDVVGTFANSAEDIGVVIDVMAGKDELDSTTIERDPMGYGVQTSNFKLQTSKVGVIKEYMEEGVEPGVSKVIEAAIGKIKSASAIVEEVSLPNLPYSLAVYYVICPAEVSSNLARYDGQRYGHSTKDAKTLDDSYFLSREQGFGAEAKRRIMIGTHVLSSGYYDAYYKKAQIVRTKIINQFNDTFKKYDFLLGPTSPTTAFKIGERTQDPLKMYLSDIMMVAANISGHPSVSLPAGRSAGLPVGLQVIAPHKHDRQLLEFAKSFGELKL